jgi:hypothetical protein
MTTRMEPENSDVPVAGVVPSDRIIGDDADDTKLLRKMAIAADEYICSFAWCQKVVRSFFAGGVGGMFAIFLFDITPTRPEVGQWIWIVIGDVPPAYLPLEDAKTSMQVFSKYVQGMMKWVQLARQGKQRMPEDGVPPINVPATPEWAEKLEKRIHLLRFTVKPFFDDEPEPTQ